MPDCTQGGAAVSNGRLGIDISAIWGSDNKANPGLGLLSCFQTAAK